MRTHTAAEVANLEDGEKVVLGGWVDSVREHKDIKFLILRDRTGTCQITAKKGEVDDSIFSSVSTLIKESVVLVDGIVKRSEKTVRGAEVLPKKIEILSVSEKILPLDQNVESNLDTRLQWRFLDFRNPKTKAIFNIQHSILKAFRNFFYERDFIEMQPPIIISSASEGGAELFPLNYFDRKAYLAQSPQLYKQMGALSFEKVFMISPVFRAEKFDQPTHLNEIRQMDAEIAFADDQMAMQLLEDCFLHILNSVQYHNKEDLKLLGVDLKIPEAPLKRITYSQAIQMLKDEGETIMEGDDFTKMQEALLTRKIGVPFFIYDWPAELKAFYAVPKPNSNLVKAYDLIYGGIEISSGTQRVNDPELLKKKIAEKTSYSTIR